MLDSSYFKKYKNILLSVIVFIVLDISVLIFNFYISYQISEDAAKINLAGHQRTLSQQITKSLLEFERAYHKSRDYSLIINDIESSMMLFDETLKAFDLGGEVVIDERIVVIPPVDDIAGRKAIDAAKPMWEIYKNYTADVLDEFKGREAIDEDLVTIFFRESILKDVVIYTTHHNIELLNVMDELTRSVENIAFEKTKNLRAAQAFAIVLAIINFFFILFFSLRKIIKSDVELDFANAEIDVMLNTMDEGVFLLDSNLIISNQYSKKMREIFNDYELAGKPLVHLLSHISDGFNEQGVRDFLKALFDKKKNMKVLSVLNPMQKVLVRIENKESVFDDKKYLCFLYSRIKTEEKIERVLVRVSDVSSEVLREQMIEDERENQLKQLRLMSALMNNNADMLPLFFQRSFYCFDNISSVLKTPASSAADFLYRVERISELLEEFKAEAKRLCLDSLLEVADNLSDEVDKLKGRKSLGEDDFSGLSSVLEYLISHTESIYKFSNKLLLESTRSSARASESEGDALPGAVITDLDWPHLHDFARLLADKRGKKIELVSYGLNDYLLPKNTLKNLNSILLQLIFYLVDCDLEAPQSRSTKQKKSSGLIDIRFSQKSPGGYYLTVRGDGLGSGFDHLGVDSSSLATIKGKSIKWQHLFLILSSYGDQQFDNDLYEGEVVTATELMGYLSQAGVKFDLQSVPGKGSVFEFMFPASIGREV